MAAVVDPGENLSLSVEVAANLGSLRAPSPKPGDRRPSARWADPTPVGGLTYIDFMPIRKDDRFSALIEQANAWLQDHPDWEVRNCESIEFRLGSEHFYFTNAEKMTFYDEDTTSWMRFVRGLRIWVVERMGGPKKAQVIAYFNVIPRIEDTICGKPRFQTLDTVLDNINLTMQETPLEGRIITIETIRIKFSPFHRFIDPDILVYYDRGYNLFIFRIFYERGDPANEIIAIDDFKANCLQQEISPLNTPIHEDFTTVIRKVQDWCARRRRDMRVCNTQTFFVKIKNGEVDTQRMFYTEHKDYNCVTHFARIIRVAYVYPALESSSYPDQKPIRICCRTFLPVQLSTRGFFSPPNFETMSQTRDRIALWILKNNARVISAETCAVRMYTGGERFDGPDATYTFIKGRQNEHWIYVFRLFLDGRYPGVPPEMDRSAFQAWNQDPLTITSHQQIVEKDELCSIQ